jgi:methyl-accepting chemotaxis protein
LADDPVDREERHPSVPDIAPAGPHRSIEMTLTVRSKLIGLAALSLLGISVLAMSSMVEMTRVYTGASYANENTVPSILTLDQVQYGFSAQRLKFWKMLAQTDAAKIAALRHDVQIAQDQVQAGLKNFEPNISDDKDRAMLAADRAALSAYDAVFEKALALADANHKPEAVDLIMNNEALVASAEASIGAHQAYNKELGVAGAAAGLHMKATAQAIEVAIVIVVGSLVLLVAFLVTRNLTGQLGGEPAEVALVAQKVALGDFSTPIALRPGDAVSLFASVARMQQSLRERAEADRTRAADDRARAEADRESAAENARIRIALDRVSVGVMLADNDSKIIYSNDFSVKIFRERASEIRKQLPQFDVERIVGSSFDAFHRAPSHQRNLMAGLKTTHTADVKMGNATLRIIANPVVDPEGRRLGTVVQWIDRTEEVAIEQEVQATVAGALDGDMTIRVTEDGKEGFFKILAAGMNRLIGNMGEVLQKISIAASEVGAGAEEISRGNADLSQRTEQQASSLEETASSMEQMTTAVKNNADNAAQASQLALAARDQAERGGSVVQSAVAAMSEINSSSRKIADIIGVIDAIAFQTNLLALNAAVEAARAGEQGRGFAVVASEVRNLASRSAAAAKEIKGLIQESVAKVDDGTKLVDASGRVLQEIVAGVKKVTDVVAEIAASSQEQSSGIGQVNRAVMSMDEATQQNAALVEQATAAAQSLNEQAAGLTQLMARFQVGGAPGAATPARRRSSPAKTPPAPSAERRAPTRAWNKATVKPGPTSATKPVPNKIAAGGTDAEWTQF